MSDPNAQDPFEMFRRLWGPLGLPVPGMAMPTLDPAELDKRIAELKAIEGWVAMNLNMLRLSIQGLEMQRFTLQAMQAAVSGATASAPAAPSGPPADLAAGNAAAQGMLWPWTVLQQAMADAARQAGDAPPPGAPPGSKGP